jgi:hypothetical protein
MNGGWCKNPKHGGHDHVLRDSCVEPVTYAELDAQLLAEAHEHDRRVAYSSEAAYVAQHRPY